MPDNCLQSDKARCPAAEIYKEHGDLIRRVIRYHIKNECEADDLFQDFFLHLVANALPDDVKCVESYLYRSLMNFIIGTARRATAYQARLHRYAKDGRPTREDVMPEEPVINAEETQKMLTLITTLLPGNRGAAVIQRYKDDLEIHEVAKAMDLDVKSVSRYISVGVSKIHRIVTVGEGNSV